MDPSPRDAFLPVCPSIPRRAAPACSRPAHLSFSMPALPEAVPGHAARVHVGSLVSAAAPWGLWRVFWTWPAGAPVGGGEGTATCPGASGRQVAGALILPQLCRAAVTPSGSTRGRGRRAWGTGSGKLRLEGGTQVLQQGQGSGAWCRVCSVWKEACGSCDGVGHGAYLSSHFRLRAGTHSQAPYVFLGFFFLRWISILIKVGRRSRCCITTQNGCCHISGLAVDPHGGDRLVVAPQLVTETAVCAPIVRAVGCGRMHPGGRGQHLSAPPPCCHQLPPRPSTF